MKCAVNSRCYKEKTNKTSWKKMMTPAEFSTFLEQWFGLSNANEKMLVFKIILF